MALSTVSIILSLTVIAPALAESISSTPAPLYVHTECQDINNVSAIVKTTVYEFVSALSRCTLVEPEQRGNLSVAASVLLDVFTKLNNGKRPLGNLFNYPQLTDKVVLCIQNITGLNMTKETAQEHFGLPNTLSLQFKETQCLQSARLGKCVDNVYDEAVKDENTIVHRQMFADVFEEIVSYCEIVAEREDRNKGHALPPSSVLLTSVAGLLCKLSVNTLYHTTF